MNVRKVEYEVWVSEQEVEWFAGSLIDQIHAAIYEAWREADDKKWRLGV